MKRSILVIAVLILSLAGCLQMETKISVDRNGAGTIERSFVVGKDLVDMMRGMQAFDTGGSQTGLFDEAAIRQAATKMGEGVSFVSASPIKNAMGEGYKAVYSFRDISRLRLDQTPGDALPIAGMGGPGSEDSGEYLTFAFSRGNPARLQVRLYQSDDEDDQDWDDADEDWDDDEDSILDAEMIRQFYKDMKMHISIQAGQTIVDSDADHRQGNVVTLMDVDFGAMAKTPEAFEILASNKIKTLDQMKEFSRYYPGLQMESKKEVQIRFR